jgi:hypothetical protein
MTGCNPVDTPMEQRVKIVTAKLVGLASRFMEIPGKEHWAVVKRIVRYIAGTINYGCRFTKEEIQIWLYWGIKIVIIQVI